MDEQTRTALARRFYEAYCASSDWKNFQGNPCPQWPDLPEAVRKHWGAVADDAAMAFAPVAPRAAG